MSFISWFSLGLCASQPEEDAEDEAEVRSSYPLQLLLLNSRRAHRRKLPVGLERPTTHLGMESRAKVGSLQPNTVPIRGHFDRSGLRNFFSFGQLLEGSHDREGDGYGDLRLSCTSHLPAPQIAIEAL